MSGGCIRACRPRPSGCSISPAPPLAWLPSWCSRWCSASAWPGPAFGSRRRRSAEAQHRRAPLVSEVMADVATEGLTLALDAERAIEPKSNLRASWEVLLKEARACTRCDLYKYATQTVFGEG